MSRAHSKSMAWELQVSSRRSLLKSCALRCGHAVRRWFPMGAALSNDGVRVVLVVEAG
jgi:hypothetical protein